MSVSIPIDLHEVLFRCVFVDLSIPGLWIFPFQVCASFHSRFVDLSISGLWIFPFQVCGSFHSRFVDLCEFSLCVFHSRFVEKGSPGRMARIDSR